MSRLSYKKYERTIKNLIRDYLDGYLTYSNYVDRAEEVYDLAWNDKNINTGEYMVLSLLVQESYMKSKIQVWFMTSVKENTERRCKPCPEPKP